MLNPGGSRVTLSAMPESHADLPRTRLNLRTVIVVLAILLVGFLCLYISTWLDPNTQKTPILFLEQCATAFLVGGVWSAVSEWFLKKDFIETVRNHSAKVEQIIARAKIEESVGLVEVAENSNNCVPLQQMLADAKDITIVLNDGRTWASTNAQVLKTRLNDPSKSTTVILVHPDSIFIETLARKVDSRAMDLSTKIRETVRILQGYCRGADKSRLKVFGHRYFNPHSLFMSERRLIITPYFTSPGRRQVPAYIYENTRPGSFYEQTRGDLETLLDRAERIDDCVPDTENP